MAMHLPRWLLAQAMPLYGGGFWPAFTQLALLYYSVGALLHWVVPSLLPVQGIQVSQRKPGAVARDALYSLGVLYCCAACAALDFLHDAWFYWTHRLLHCPALYRHVHYIHHKSSVPSAFTGYSFHVLEAALVFANEVLVVWLLPLHLGLHRMYHLVTTIVHLGGHAGYEMAPFIPTLEGLVLLALRGWRAHSPELNTVQHHDMHHRYRGGKGAVEEEQLEGEVLEGEGGGGGGGGGGSGGEWWRCQTSIIWFPVPLLLPVPDAARHVVRYPFAHFSLYFTHWDRWCGTLHAKYEDTLFRYFGAVNPASAPGMQSAGHRPNEADMARCSSTPLRHAIHS
ncbi:hypothetical protein QJQ45_014604 [Haematococcus lacustris]|nr:hypothetical protein QJQ45_014604 [Haematococcus lacustris]